CLSSSSYHQHRDLHSFPTRRSSDLSSYSASRPLASPKRELLMDLIASRIRSRIASISALSVLVALSASSNSSDILRACFLWISRCTYITNKAAIKMAPSQNPSSFSVLLLSKTSAATISIAITASVLGLVKNWRRRCFIMAISFTQLMLVMFLELTIVAKLLQHIAAQNRGGRRRALLNLLFRTHNELLPRMLTTRHV